MYRCPVPFLSILSPSSNAAIVSEFGSSSGIAAPSKIVLNIIIHAGNAKAKLYEALQASKENDFDKADNLFSKTIICSLQETIYAVILLNF